MTFAKILANRVRIVREENMDALSFLIKKWDESSLELRDAEALIRLLISYKTKIEHDLGLTKIALEHNKILLASCETALADRDGLGS